MHVCISVHVDKWREIGSEKEKERNGDCNTEVLLFRD